MHYSSRRSEHKIWCTNMHNKHLVSKNAQQTTIQHACLKFCFQSNNTRRSTPILLCIWSSKPNQNSHHGSQDATPPMTCLDLNGRQERCSSFIRVWRALDRFQCWVTVCCYKIAEEFCHLWFALFFSILLYQRLGRICLEDRQKSVPAIFIEQKCQHWKRHQQTWCERKFL